MLTILAFVTSVLLHFSPFILRSSNRLFLYDALFYTLISTPNVSIPIFLGYTSKALRMLSPIIIYFLFQFIISSTWSDYRVIYTYGSVSTKSAGFSFYILSIQLSFSDSLPYFDSFYTAKTFAVRHELIFIQVNF